MRRFVVVALLLVVAGAACSDDGNDAASTTTEAGPTTSVSVDEPTASTDAAPACTIPDPSGTDEPLDIVGARLDDDDVVDEAFTMFWPDRWVLRAELGDGGRAQEELSTVESDSARAAAARDLDGDGDDELFVIVGNGASAQIYGIYDLDGCDLEALQFVDGTPVELAVGGSVVELHGVRCEDDGGLTVLDASSENGVDYLTNERTYEIADGVLTETGTVGALSITTDSPDFPAFSQFDC